MNLIPLKNLKQNILNEVKNKLKSDGILENLEQFIKESKKEEVEKKAIAFTDDIVDILFAFEKVPGYMETIFINLKGEDWRGVLKKEMRLKVKEEIEIYFNAIKGE